MNTKFIQILIDHAEGTGTFAKEREDWSGHSGGEIYMNAILELFVTLSQPERTEFAMLLVSATAGRVGELAHYTGHMSSLVGLLAFSGYGEYLKDNLQLLVDALNSESNIQEWMTSDDSNINPEITFGLNDYRYFLTVSSTLRQLNFRGFYRTYLRLMENAQSANFRESLERNLKIFPTNLEA